MDIETALAKVSLTRVEKRDPYKQFHKMTRAQLQALTPAFQWTVYFKTSSVPDTSAINVTEPAFYKELQTLLQSRSLADWKTYLRWHLVHAKAPYLSSPFALANFEFYNKYLQGLEEMPPRWKRCVRRVDADLGEALGQVFVQKTFGPDTKQRALVMTKGIEAAMESEIRQLPWMGEATKQRALEKLHGIVNKIGYPDKWRDYSSIKIAREDYFGNVERATAFESRRELAKIGKPVDKTEWVNQIRITADGDPYYLQESLHPNYWAQLALRSCLRQVYDDGSIHGGTCEIAGKGLVHGEPKMRLH